MTRYFWIVLFSGVGKIPYGPNSWPLLISGEFTCCLRKFLAENIGPNCLRYKAKLFSKQRRLKMLAENWTLPQLKWPFWFFATNLLLLQFSTYFYGVFLKKPNLIFSQYLGAKVLGTSKVTSFIPTDHNFLVKTLKFCFLRLE